MKKLYFDDYYELVDFIYTMSLDSSTEDGVALYCDPVDAMEILKLLIIKDSEEHNVLQYDFIQYDGICYPEYDGPYLIIISDLIVSCERAARTSGGVLVADTEDIFTVSEYASDVRDANGDEYVTTVIVGEYPEEEDEEDEEKEALGTLTLLFNEDKSDKSIQHTEKNLIGFNFHGADNGFTFDADLRADKGSGKIIDVETLGVFIDGVLSVYDKFVNCEED